MADHPHHQHHHHHHDQAQDDVVLETGDAFFEKNRAHWDKFATSYTAEQWQRDMINDVTSFLLSQKTWLGVPFLDPATQFESKPSQQGSQPSIRVLDYACGPGTLTSALAGLATEYVGIDLSANMVKAYNTRFAPPTEENTEAQAALDAARLKTEELNAHAVVGNLLHPSNSTPSIDEEGGKYTGFDLAMVGFGFHHFEDPSLAAKRLAERLKSGGVLLIIDFLPHAKDEQHQHHHQHHDGEEKASFTKEDAQHERHKEASGTVAHHGFSEEKIKSVFENDAGLKDVEIKIMPGQVLMRGLSPRTTFLARGVKP